MNGRVSDHAPIAPRAPMQHFPEIPHQCPSPAAFSRGVPLHGGQPAPSCPDPPPYRRPINRPVLGPEFTFQPAGGFNDVVRYAGGSAAPDGLEHTTRREGDAQLQPVELGVAPAVQHHSPGRLAVTPPTTGFLIVRLRAWPAWTNAPPGARQACRSPCLAGGLFVANSLERGT